MGITAANVGLLAGGFFLYLLARRRLLRPGSGEDDGRRRIELIATLGVASLAFLGFLTAQMGMNASLTGRAAVTDLDWLVFALVFGNLLVLAHLALRLLGSRSDQLLLPVVGFLVFLGLVNVYVAETRDANAYVSTVALPALRDHRAALAKDPSLAIEERAELEATLGPVPDELRFEAETARAATVLDRRWLVTYNDAIARLADARERFPASLAEAPEVRAVSPGGLVRRQLIAMALGVALVPLLFVAVRRRGGRPWGTRTALALTCGLALTLVGAASLSAGGAGRLPPLLRLGGESLTIYELLKLVLVATTALSLGLYRSGDRRAAVAGLVATVLGGAGMLRHDPGAGAVLLAIVAVLGSLVAGRRARLAGVVAGAAVLAVLPIGARLLDDHLPETVRVRIAVWTDPWGSNHRAELENLVASSIDRLQEARAAPPGDVQEGELILVKASTETAPVTSLLDDVGKIEQELRWRLAALESRQAGAEPFVPGESESDERVLLEAERLWAGLGGFSTGSSDRAAMSRLHARVDGAVDEFRARAQALADPARAGTAGQLASLAARAPDSFQLQRSLFALREGGALGVGLGQGRPEAIPDMTEDVPLVGLGESLGFPVVALIGLFFLLIASRAMQAARRVPDPAQALLVAGLSALLCLQVLINIGGMSGAFPFTGLSLPLVSRSGTGLVANLLALALILAILDVARRQGEAAPATTAQVGGPLRIWGIPAAFALVLASVAVLQLTGRTLTPGPVLAELPGSASGILHASNQWELLSYRVLRGPIVDRDGQVLARTPALASSREHPDPDLSTSLAQTLQQLELSFGDELLAGAAGDGPPQLVTTIDAGVQLAVAHAIDRGASEGGLADPGSLRGAVVLLDVRTGEIVAIASRPTFSLGELVDPGLWAANEAVERRTGFSYRYLNRPIQGYYPPGSVFKTVTAAGALEFGLHHADSPDFDYREGETGPRAPDGILHFGPWHWLELRDGPPIDDANHPNERDWLFDIEEAFAYSCNVAFAEVGIELGAARLADLAHRFGFEQPLAVEGLGTSTSTLDTDSSRAPDERLFGETTSSVARTAFGQAEVSATPLQIALIPAAIANGGTIMQPRVVAGIRRSDGSWIRQFEPRVLRETGFSERTIGELRQLMTAVVTYGSAKTAAVNPLNHSPGVAGKTGSAEWSDERDATHSWFAGYFPAESPRLAVAVVIERGGPGAQVAARIARHIFASEQVAAYLRERP